MQVVAKIRLFKNQYTICCISEDNIVFPNKSYYKSIGVTPGECGDVPTDEDKTKNTSVVKYTANAMFLQPFVKECIYSDTYRTNLVMNLNKLSKYPENGVIYLKLILVPPDTEIIDYSWNEKLLKLIWTRVEIENAFSWLSTLGGAYSALGDYFGHCAEEAGRISKRQYILSKILGDDSLAERSKLYSAISCAQQGDLRLSRQIVRGVADFAISTRDKRLIRMCQGVWAKLKYMKSLNTEPGKKNAIEGENGNIEIVS